MRLNIPLYNQLDDKLPDGRPDPYATTDCGSECVAMVAAAYGYGGDPGFSAGQVRVIIRHGDLNGTGITTAADLCYGLARIAKIPSHERNVNADAMFIEVGRALAADLPCIILGRWVDPTALHWVVAVDLTPQFLVVNDPWGGKQRSIARTDVARLYAGSYVHIDLRLGG